MHSAHHLCCALTLHQKVSSPLSCRLRFGDSESLHHWNLYEKEENRMICSSFLSLNPFARVREDMDVSTGTLIGAHGYCTQVWFELLRDIFVWL